MKLCCGANLEVWRCTVASPVYGLKGRLCVPKLHGFSKKLLPLCKDNQKRSITCSASQVDEPNSEFERGLTPGIWGYEGLNIEDAYFVSASDCMGTKFMLAFQSGIHDTIGIDLVAINVNEIVTSGAKPIFFHDYFATKDLNLDLADKVTQGIKYGCKQSDCHLIDFEIGDIPKFHARECELCGIAVGVVKKDSVIDGKSIKVGDILIGLPSSGSVHSNGFSLIKSVLNKSGLSLKDQLPGESITLGEALIAPIDIYVKQVLDIISKGGVKGIAHITEGLFTNNNILQVFPKGFTNNNILRVFPKGLGALIYKGSWTIPPVFKWIQEAGRIEDAKMMQTFNMGIGMVLVVSPEAADRILGEVQKTSIAYRIGEVVKGHGVSYS